MRNALALGFADVGFHLAGGNFGDAARVYTRGVMERKQLTNRERKNALRGHFG